MLKMDQNNKSTKSIHSSILEQVISKQVKIRTFNFQRVLNLSVTTSLRQRCLFICGVKVYHGQRASKVSCISNENKSLYDMG